MNRPVHPVIADAVTPRIDRGLPIGILLAGASLAVSLTGHQAAALLPVTSQPLALDLILPVSVGLALAGLWSARCLFSRMNRTITLLATSLTLLAAALTVAAALPTLLAAASIPEVPWLIDYQMSISLALGGAGLGVLIPTVFTRQRLAQVPVAMAAVEQTVQQASDRLRAVSDRLTAVANPTQSQA